MKFLSKLFHRPSRQKAKSYEGATTGRRLGTWGLSDIGPNSAVQESLPQLRARSRDLVRNNPWVASGYRSLVSNLIGCGITPRWELDDVALKATIQQRWYEWTNQSDVDGRSDFYGQQYLVAQTLLQSGEALVRMVPQKKSKLNVVPFQLQVLEPDFLVDDLISSTENKIHMGIELNAKGHRIAYHLYNQHPGDMTSVQAGTLRIPAKEILHVYRVDRPGQLRGVPWIASVLLKLRELDQYEDAELVRKKTAAMFSGFVTKSAPEFGRGISDDDKEDPRNFKLQPGMFQILAPGENIEFSKSADVGSSYEIWIKQQLRAVAAGMGVTYEQLTGDLHGVNYSSIRAGLIEFRRQVECLQHHVIVQQLCQPIATQWIELGVLSGVLKIPDYFHDPIKYHRIQWQPPGWDWVDPLKDVQSEILAMEHNLKARQDIIAKYGMDAEEVDRKISHDHLRVKNLQLKVNNFYDPDPDE